MLKLRDTTRTVKSFWETRWRDNMFAGLLPCHLLAVHLQSKKKDIFQRKQSVPTPRYAVARRGATIILQPIVGFPQSVQLVSRATSSVWILILNPPCRLASIPMRFESGRIWSVTVRTWVSRGRNMYTFGFRFRFQSFVRSWGRFSRNVFSVKGLCTYVRIRTLRLDKLLDVLRTHDRNLYLMHHLDPLPLMTLE